MLSKRQIPPAALLSLTKLSAKCTGVVMLMQKTSDRFSDPNFPGTQLKTIQLSTRGIDNDVQILIFALKSIRFYTWGRNLFRMPKLESISNLPPRPTGIACLYLQFPAVVLPCYKHLTRNKRAHFKEQSKSFRIRQLSPFISQCKCKFIMYAKRLSNQVNNLINNRKISTNI